MDFYQRVKTLVKTKNKNLRDFIISLEINYDTYNSAKKAENLPRGDDCVRIAQSLGTTVEFLVTGQTHNPAEEKLSLIKEKLDEINRMI
ncbi:MAG: hypothetical protein ACRC5H_03945 [Treponemataceae bacterium]